MEMSNESNFYLTMRQKAIRVYSNFHYLNEREQLEYNYLLKKRQGAYEEVEVTWGELYRVQGGANDWGSPCLPIT